MLIPGMTQALIAAFSFGILVNAASAGFILLLKGHGSRSSRSGPRLALITFLASSTLWAQVEFTSSILDTTATTACNVTTVLSALFDQIARVAIEQTLLWVLADKKMKSTSVLIPEVLVLARFVVGIVFVAETRPQFKPTCVPVSNSVPLALAVIALDAVILAVILLKAFLWRRSKEPSTGQESGSKKAVLMTIGGLALWMGTSVTLLLGLRRIDLIFRTTLPAVGLSVLVSLVTLLSRHLSVPRETPSQLLGAPDARDLNATAARDLTTADSGYPPSRYEDLKGGDTFTVTAFASQPSPPRREVPRGNNGLPLISRPVTGVTGVGGMPIHGQLFPPLRSNPPMEAYPPSQSQSANKISPSGTKSKGIFDRSRGDLEKANRVGKLAISNPIPVDSTEMQTALNKVSTVDLETAARNEKARRDIQAQESMDLIAKRPAPQPPSIPLEEAVRRATSTKRKNVPSRSSSETSRSTTAGALSVEVNASSTSTQLSPGVEDLRRRSPRQPMASSVSSVKPLMPGESFRIPIARIPSAPQPSRMPVLAKGPSQQRAAPGQSSVVRQQGSKMFTQSSGSQAQQTVMLINNIEYDDPNTVNDIIQEASKTPKSASMPLELLSVVHRPRPIPRKSERDRQVFPAELSPGTPGHRRSRSSSSVHSRKSALQSEPGSPTQLPPLPLPPMTPTSFSRPRPPKPKNTTYGEMMSLLFPSSPSGSTSTMSTKRRSSVPTIPPVPSPYLRESESSGTQESAGPLSSNQTDSRQSQSTVFTDRSSIRTESVLGPSESIRGQVRDSDSSMAGELNDARKAPLSAIGNSKAGRLSTDGANRKSSPIIPASRFSEYSGAEDDDDYQDQVTSTVNSTQPSTVLLDAAQSRNTARKSSTRKDIGRSNVSSTLSGTGDEVMTVMLDTSAGSTASDRQPSTQDGAESWPSSVKRELLHPGQWHRRVGERPLSFTDRGENTMKARKMPPPSPLLLNRSYKENAVVDSAPSPSPLESPEAAYQVIQAQLRRLEQFQMSPGQGNDLSLIQDLEAEMGQQEREWQTMHMNFERDSLSTLQSSPGLDSRPTSIDSRKAKSPKASLAEYRASRRSRLLDRGATRPKQEDGPRLLLSQGSQTSRARLQPDNTVGTEPDSRRHGSAMIMKYESVKLMSAAAISSVNVRPSIAKEVVPRKAPENQFPTSDVARAREVATLWQPKSVMKASAQNRLWAAPIRVLEISDMPQLSVYTPVRSARRKIMEVQDEIESSSLWTKAATPMLLDRGTGLWAMHATPEAQQPLRTVSSRSMTVRRPRRNPRRTTLADILENPEPTPDKRGTFLFRFPWGEKSEHPSVRPRPSRPYMAMPGTMTTGGPRIASSFQPLPNTTSSPSDSSSSSVFEEYEDEQSDYDGEDDGFSGSDDGDDFDETTIWEIASLLKTEQTLPSKNSLLPPPLEDPFGDEFTSELLSTDESEPELEVNVTDEVETVMEEPVPRIHDPTSDLSGSRIVGAWLWTPGSKMSETRQYGLPQPREDIWQSFVINDDVMLVRSVPRIKEIGTIESKRLWMPRDKQTAGERAGPLWLSPLAALKQQHVEDNARSTSALVAPIAPPSSLLWERPVASHRPEASVGLFDIDSAKPEHRAPTTEPAALQVRNKPRKGRSIPAPLQSSQLWAVHQTTAVQPDWLLVAAIQSENLSNKFSAPTSSPSSSSKKSSHMIPLRRQYRPNIAYRQDWDSELREAITAGYPGTRFALLHATEAQWSAALHEAITASHIAPIVTRRHASPGEWAAALREALVASYPQNRLSRGQIPMVPGETGLAQGQERGLKASFDVSKRHPVFGTSSLTTEGMAFHPAATGYTHDVAMTHPIFFGSGISMTTSGLGGDVHPAMVGYLHRQAKQPGLWTKGTESSTKHSTTQFMWVPPAAAMDAPSSSSSDLPQDSVRANHHHGKKPAFPSTEVTLTTDFGEQGLWRRSYVQQQQQQSQRDWLEDSMKKRFSRIEFRY